MYISGDEIAVKRVTNESKQGLREFVAEIASIGRLRHRNLVQLLVWLDRMTRIISIASFVRKLIRQVKLKLNGVLLEVQYINDFKLQYPKIYNYS